MFVDFGKKSTKTGVPPAKTTIFTISGIVYGDIITFVLLFVKEFLTKKYIPL